MRNLQYLWQFLIVISCFVVLLVKAPALLLLLLSFTLWMFPTCWFRVCHRGGNSLRVGRLIRYFKGIRSRVECPFNRPVDIELSIFRNLFIGLIGDDLEPQSFILGNEFGTSDTCNAVLPLGISIAIVSVTFEPSIPVPLVRC